MFAVTVNISGMVIMVGVVWVGVLVAVIILIIMIIIRIIMISLRRCRCCCCCSRCRRWMAVVVVVVTVVRRVLMVVVVVKAAVVVGGATVATIYMATFWRGFILGFLMNNSRNVFRLFLRVGTKVYNNNDKYVNQLIILYTIWWVYGWKEPTTCNGL